jgi:division protein CdvB (Snf7/Vps24/ESCRT-III family)
MPSSPNHPFPPDQKFTLAPEVLLQRFEEKSLLLDLSSERIYQINDTGTRLAELIEANLSLDEMLSTLTSEYQASPDELARDVHALLHELLEEKLIVIQESD